jgi:ribose phosphate pyrophosphokinase-like protein
MPERAKDELEIFTGNSNPALAREVCEHLNVRLGEAEVGHFPDGEVLVEVRENVRGEDLGRLALDQLAPLGGGHASAGPRRCARVRRCRPSRSRASTRSRQPNAP